ncbi:unnamed protein product [Leptosia nina]|uniref:Uncharacterized protein n=1 Tax=Leptosia nina TaxID=320188 RepID=A0AAV1JFN3_9NEOP
MTVPVTAVVFLLATICRVNGYSVFEGERLKNDKLLHHSDHVKAPILFIRTSDVAFPKYFEPDDNIITAIEIIDNSQNGASAEVDYGGCSVKCYIEAIPEVPLDIDNENNFGPIFVDNRPLNGTFHSVSKKYECKATFNPPDSKLLLYGTKAWTFPVQDVDLSLKYPMVNVQSDFLITSLTVILHIDGTKSKGFINRGGIMQDHVDMTFTVSRTSRLAYQFWLVGVHKSNIDDNMPSSLSEFCK